MKKYKLTKQMPEPFNTALQLDDFSFDYHLAPNKSDHKWLQNHGYTTKMGSDCAYYVGDSSGKCIGLNATSYGDWGTAYYGDNDSDRKGFDVFCEMYNEGIVVPWRIRFYHNNCTFDYDHTDGKWQMCNHETHEWSECENPLPEILAEKKKEV